MLPTPISIQGINKSTARKLIAALLKSNGITRTDLAGTCGVSRMTAGKVVSAMCEAGYADIGEEISARGRISDFIYPSERFTFLIFDICEHTMYANVYNARENTRFTYTQPRNESVDIKTDVRSFVALVDDQLRDAEEPDTYRLSALLYHKEAAIQAQSLSKKDLTVTVERSLAAARYVAENHKNECTAFVGANDSSDIIIIAKGELIQGKGKQKALNAKAPASELEMLDTLTARLSLLFEFVIPDRVIIDSRSLHLSRRFSDELAERLTARTAIQKEKLPELVTNDGIPFPSRAVIGQLIDKYAELISAN